MKVILSSVTQYQRHKSQTVKSHKTHAVSAHLTLIFSIVLESLRGVFSFIRFIRDRSALANVSEKA